MWAEVTSLSTGLTIIEPWRFYVGQGARLDLSHVSSGSWQAFENEGGITEPGNMLLHGTDLRTCRSSSIPISTNVDLDRRSLKSVNSYMTPVIAPVSSSCFREAWYGESTGSPAIWITSKELHGKSNVRVLISRLCSFEKITLQDNCRC